MFDGHAEILRIRECLSDWSGDRIELTQAGEYYWSAAYSVAAWPPELRQWHERVLPMLLDRGTIRQTVAEATDSQAATLAQILLLFAAAALNMNIDAVPSSASGSCLESPDAARVMTGR